MTGPCSVADCDRDAHARGWCTMHYQRWKRTGHPTVVLVGGERPTECAIDGCDRPRRKSDYCGAHYARLRRHGDPLGGGEDRAPAGQPCIEDDCDRLAEVRGRCNRHAKAHRLATDPEYAERKRADWRAWAAENAESLASTRRTWRDGNPETRARLLAEWKTANPWHASAYSFTKRRRAYGLPANLAELVNPDVVYERDGGVCQLCFELVDQSIEFPHAEALTLDHVIPVSDPASEHTYANVQLAHWDCNRRRRTKPLAHAGAVA